MNTETANPTTSSSVRRNPGGGVWIPSSLWIDRPDALEILERRHEQGEINSAEAELLRFFASHGYCIFDLQCDPALCDRVQGDVEHLWRTQPSDIAYAYDGPARRLSVADRQRERAPRYRLHDIHSHAQTCRQLYLDSQVHRMMELLFGEPAIAIQSLYFEYGSEQALHRDSVVVPTARPGHLLAAWIALEDIDPRSGALAYVPGSHLLPCFETAPGEYMFDPRRMGGDVVERGLAWEARQEAERGLEQEVFAARKGQVLLWHGALRHGGTKVEDPALTRKSFVVHFSTRSTYHERSLTITESDGSAKVCATREQLNEGSCFGFQNPLVPG